MKGGWSVFSWCVYWHCSHTHWATPSVTGHIDWLHSKTENNKTPLCLRAWCCSDAHGLQSAKQKRSASVWRIRVWQRFEVICYISESHQAKLCKYPDTRVKTTNQTDAIKHISSFWSWALYRVHTWNITLTCYSSYLWDFTEKHTIILNTEVPVNELLHTWAHTVPCSYLPFLRNFNLRYQKPPNYCFQAFGRFLNQGILKINNYIIHSFIH